MSKTFYTKEGDDFVPVGYEFSGFPADGIWWVKDGKQNCIEQLAPCTEPTFEELSRVKWKAMADELVQVINKRKTARHTVLDIAEIACEFFHDKSVQAEERKVEEELFTF